MALTDAVHRRTTAGSPRHAVIGGELVTTDDVLSVIDPATAQELATTVRGNAALVDQASAAARAAQPAWSRRPAAERSGLLLALAALIRRNHGELAALESQDTGKPMAQARADVTVAARYFEFYAHTLDAFYGDSLPPNAGFHAWTRHVPFGVTGHIIPWNYPLQIGCRTIAPALAVGNCAVVKPAEDAPLSVIRVAELALEAGLPGGALNVVPGLGAEAGDALARHDGIDHLSFTGSLAIGSAVAKAAAENVKPTALELGGKSPNIVFADADLKAALPVIAKSMLQNAGQTCSAGSRLLVHESVADRVIDGLAHLLSAVTIGRGLDDPDLGPLISRKQHNRVTAMVERAEDSGLTRVRTPREGAVPQEGFFFEPAVFRDVPREAEIAREEVFGPVVAATTFTTQEEAIALANGTDYGLIAAVWTTDLNTAHTMAEEVAAGQVYLNTYGAGGGVEYAFGGFRKSGYGREKGYEALSEFTQSKTVILKVDS